MKKILVALFIVIGLVALNVNAHVAIAIKPPPFIKPTPTFAPSVTPSVTPTPSPYWCDETGYCCSGPECYAPINPNQ